MAPFQTGNSNDYEVWVPGDDFEQQIDRYRGVHGTECGFVGCRYRNPDFKAFDEAQLQYYLWFRERFYDGEVIQTDLGYAWLLLVELINTRDDPEAVMEHLHRFHKACSGRECSFPAQSTVADAMASYAVANGLDVPRIYMPASVWRQILISEILLPEPEPFPYAMIYPAAGCPFGDSWGQDAECKLSYDLFNAALPAVDAKMKELTGKGILETYGDVRTDVVKLFSDTVWNPTVYFHDDRCAVTYTAAYDALQVFLGAMLSYCRKAIGKDSGAGNGPTVASLFNAEYRKAVDSALGHGGISEPQRRPKAVRGSVRNWNAGDAMAPVVMSGKGFAHEKPSNTFYDDMVGYSGQLPPGSREYVPSGFFEPDYRHLSPEALEYYLWWRERARKGEYGVTDEGYLWLYKCELINAYDDVHYVLDQLSGLAGAYDRYFEFEWFGETKKLGRTYIDYAYVKGLRIPDPTVYPCMLSASDMIEMLLDGKEDTPVSANTMLLAAQLDTGKKADNLVCVEFDDDCARIAARVLIGIENSCSGGVIRSYCRLRTKKIKLEVFPREKYHNWPTGRKKAQEREMLNIMDNVTFVSEMRVLLKAVLVAVRDRNSPGKGKATVTFGVKSDGIIRAEVERWFSEKEGEKAAGTARDFSIDLSEVERAQADLDHVTAIMSTEGPAEADEEPVPEAPGSVPDDPWQAFADRMNKGQREYLRKALAGTIRAVKPVIEDSINAVAMDTVKDTVVGNGKVFDEYADDMEKALEPGGGQAQ